MSGTGFAVRGIVEFVVTMDYGIFQKQLRYSWRCLVVVDKQVKCCSGLCFIRQDEWCHVSRAFVDIGQDVFAICGDDTKNIDGASDVYTCYLTRMSWMAVRMQDMYVGWLPIGLG